MIVEETNHYAAMNVVISPHSRPWYNVTIEEMKAFVGMLIAMGILKFPRLELYWSNKYPHITTPGISNILARVPDYQAYMRGVDRGDQWRKYYNIGRRSKKWWKRLFGYSIEVFLLNAFVLDASVRPAEHARHGRGNSDFLTFRLEVANELIAGFSSCQCSGRPRSMENAQLDRLNPSLGYRPVHTDTKANCIVCLGVIGRKKLPIVGNRHESRVQCSHCKIHLCVAAGRPCFQ